jgi:hypothetical protein
VLQTVTTLEIQVTVFKSKMSHFLVIDDVSKRMRTTEALAKATWYVVSTWTGSSAGIEEISASCDVSGNRSCDAENYTDLN